MEQQQVQQLQLQAAVDALKGTIDALLQDKMNLAAQNIIFSAQLQESLKKEQELNKLVASLQDQQKAAQESQKQAPVEAS